MYECVLPVSIFIPQLSHEKNESLKLKETMSSKIADFDQQEQQFHAEHEEEVRALQQQKWQLQRQLEDLKGHYQQVVGQDQQVCVCVCEGGGRRELL